MKVQSKSRIPCFAAFAVLTLLISGGLAPAQAQRSDADALRAVQSMRERGEPAAKAAEELRRSYSYSDLAAAQTLRDGGYDAGSAAVALQAEYRSGGYVLYEILRKADYSHTDVVSALYRAGERVAMDCIDPQGYGVPCGNFGVGNNEPAMGQVTWTPMEQGEVDGLLKIENTNIPEVEVTIGNTTLEIEQASSSQVMARLPSAPISGALALVRVSDGVVGELDPSYEVEVDWAAIGLAATDAAAGQVNRWLKGAKILEEKCEVVGPSAIGLPGVLATDKGFDGAIAQSMIEAGAPAEVAQALAAAFEDAWTEWADNVMIPKLPFYPAFAAWPGESAAPMLNVPFPLTALADPANTKVGEMAATALGERIDNAIVSTSTAMQTALESFATALGDRFSTMLESKTVQSVFGWGPIPTYIPPYSVVGPVVGHCAGVGVLLGPRF